MSFKLHWQIITETIALPLAFFSALAFFLPLHLPDSTQQLKLHMTTNYPANVEEHKYKQTACSTQSKLESQVKHIMEITGKWRNVKWKRNRTATHKHQKLCRLQFQKWRFKTLRKLLMSEVPTQLQLHTCHVFQRRCRVRFWRGLLAAPDFAVFRIPPTTKNAFLDTRSGFTYCPKMLMDRKGQRKTFSGHCIWE